METKIYKLLSKNEYAAYSIEELASKLHAHPIDVALVIKKMINNNDVEKIVDTDWDTMISTSKYKLWVRYVGKMNGEFRVTSFPQPETVRVTSKTINNCYKLIADKYDLKDLGCKLFD